MVHTGETVKREGEGGSARERECERERTEGTRRVRERERERRTKKEREHGVRDVFRGVAKLRVITARGSVSAVRVQSIKELRPARNCLGFILLGTGCGNVCRKRIPFDPLRSPSPRVANDRTTTTYPLLPSLPPSLK